jgi:glutathione S-transferase
MNPWLTLVTIAALLFYFFTGIAAVRVRTRVKIFAPAMGGHPHLEQALRVQGNTLEWIVIFVPALWMAGSYFDPRIAAGIGVVWILGRILYMRGYMHEDPTKRGPGFGIQALASGALLVMALVGAVMHLINHTA